MILPLLLQAAAGSASATRTEPIRCPTDRVCATALETVAAVLRPAGARPVSAKTADGRDELQVTDGTARYRVTASGCDQPGGCDTLIFTARYAAERGYTAAFANRWNRAWSFVSMTLLDDGRMELNMDVLLPGGIEKRQMATWITVWQSSVNGLKNFYDADVKAQPIGPAAK